MEDKSVLQIIGEILIGVLLMVPFIFNETNDYTHIMWIDVIFRLLYSLGIPIIIVKTMSLCYRFISVIGKNLLVKQDNLYFLLWIIFVVLGFSLWYKYLFYFKKGYIWAEIIGYFVSAFWFLLDVNTTRCCRALNLIVVKLGTELKKHKDFVEKYKQCVDFISKEKRQVVRDMDKYYDRTKFHDPRKNLDKDMDIQYADQYQNYIPLYDKEYKGFAGLLDGMTAVRLYAVRVNKYIVKLEEDREWMEKEITVYDGQISKMQQQLKVVEECSSNYHSIKNMKTVGVDKDKFEENLIREMISTKESTKNVNDVWKMNKRINKMRRKHYGR